MTDFPDRDEWTDKLFEIRRDTGECDCCYRTGYLCRVEAFGIETYACEDCRGVAKERLCREAEESIETEKAALEREKAEQRATFDEAAEWDELDDTDLFSTEDRTKRTDLSNNDFSDV